DHVAVPPGERRIPRPLVANEGGKGALGGRIVGRSGGPLLVHPSVCGAVFAEKHSRRIFPEVLRVIGYRGEVQRALESGDPRRPPRCGSESRRLALGESVSTGGIRPRPPREGVERVRGVNVQIAEVDVARGIETATGGSPYCLRSRIGFGIRR